MIGCEGCIYESDAQQLRRRGYLMWGSSQPHPCVYCQRMQISYEDHYLTPDAVEPKECEHEYQPYFREVFCKKCGQIKKPKVGAEELAKMLWENCGGTDYVQPPAIDQINLKSLAQAILERYEVRER